MPSPFASLSSVEVPKRSTKRQYIYDMLLARIQDKTLPLGARIPSATELSSQWKVAYTTIHAALNDLTRDGWLIRHPRTGTFVSEPPLSPEEQQRRKTALILLPDQNDGNREDAAIETIKGFTQGAKQVGWQVRIESLPDEKIMEEETLEQIKNYGGALFFGLQQYGSLMARLHEERQRMVTIALTAPPGCTAVSYQRQKAVGEVVDDLLKRGYRRLGYLGQTVAVPSDPKFRYFLDHLKERAVAFDPQYALQCARTSDATPLIKQVMEATGRVDAWIVSHAKVALALANHGEQSGLTLGKDLRLVTFGASHTTLQGTPISRVGVPYFQFGMEAIRALANEAPPPPLIEIEASLVHGATT